MESLFATLKNIISRISSVHFSVRIVFWFSFIPERNFITVSKEVINLSLVSGLIFQLCNFMWSLSEIFFFSQVSVYLRMIISLREKCPNTELFLVRIFSYSDWIRIRNNSVFGHISRSVCLTHFSPVSHFYTTWKCQMVFWRFQGL